MRIHLLTVCSSDALLCVLADPAAEQKAWDVVTNWPFNPKFEFVSLLHVWISGCVWGPWLKLFSLLPRRVKFEMASEM